MLAINGLKFNVQSIGRKRKNTAAAKMAPTNSAVIYDNQLDQPNLREFDGGYIPTKDIQTQGFTAKNPFETDPDM